ncbi:Uroporphyrinogen decarboxylase [Halotydeus destructor]|nr:Uroporphyrinogen decarboxylase [Halotydeus destructor]
MSGIISDFPPLKNDIVLKAALGEPTPFVPVWVMRQAGRYLPEFREVRCHHDFFQICQTPELACEITLQPIRRFNLDAAIIFSDILVIPQALGMEVIMTPGEGPTFPKPLAGPADLKTLNKDVDVSKELKYVYDAITLTRRQLDGKVPLLGFVGAPWTLMAYMIEGKGSKTQSNAKKWLYQHPYESHELLSLLTTVITDHLVEQIKAGAQMVQVFDTSAGYLPQSTFEQFAQPYLLKIATDVKQKQRDLGLTPVPMVVFAKDAHYSLEALGKSREFYDVVSLDWTMNPKQSRARVGDGITLQGNLDPCALYSDNDTIDYLVSEMVAEYGNTNYIANLGHGIYPDVKPEAMNTFVNAVHKHSRKMSK